jgi:hypothetical protein
MTISRNSLMTLEAYAKVRNTMRAQVIEHKKKRCVHLGNHLMFLFEDETTIRYQIQEMLYIEKIFDEDGITAELQTYLPLVPDGNNFKATMQIEYANESERRAALSRLIGIQDRIFMTIGRETPIYAVADEDLVRENSEKTSAVHFLRFELTDSMKHSIFTGAPLLLGCDHPHYPVAPRQVPEDVANALRGDLQQN